MEKVLITGGAGYLGNILSRDLLYSGREVVCLDNLMYGQGDSIFPLASNPHYTFVFGDVRNEELVRECVSKSDIIIPLAAIVGEPACKRKPDEAKSINLGAISYLESIVGKNQRVICPISNSGYGTKSGNEFCTEETPLEPISLYGKTKVDAEKIFLDSPNEAITLRLATVFGVSPRMRRDLLVNDFVYQAVTNKNIVLFEPHFKRNFVHISDVSKAFIHSIDNFSGMKNEPYNVGIDSANMSKAQLAEKIAKKIPEFEIYISETGKDTDKRNYVVSNEKIKDKGFVAETTIEQGIDELIRGYNMILKNIPYTNL